MWQNRLIQATQDCVDRARTVYPRHHIDDVIVLFDLKGAQAGQYRSDGPLIRYNGQIASRQLDAFIKRTVVHEVAHHVVQCVWGAKAQPHGAEWRQVMELLGARDINRCHNYNLEGVQCKQQRRFEYHCACRTHALSSTRHNRVGTGTRYFCRACRQELRPLTEAVASV